MSVRRRKSSASISGADAAQTRITNRLNCSSPTRGCGTILGVDPVTIIVAAVALGAQEGIREAAAGAIKDAYAGLKRILVDKYQSVDPSGVENKPTSEIKKASLEEDLVDAGAADDADLLAAAQKLIEEVRAADPGAGSGIGLDLKDLETEALRIQRLRAEGGGVSVRVQGAKVSGPMEITDITSGPTGPSLNP